MEGEPKQEPSKLDQLYVEYEEARENLEQTKQKRDLGKANDSDVDQLIKKVDDLNKQIIQEQEKN